MLYKYEKEGSFLKKGIIVTGNIGTVVPRVKPYKFILCLGWSGTLCLSILGCGGCHDNTVIKVLQEMYCDVQKCTTMHYLTVFMATAKQLEAVKCVAYENS